MKNSVDDSEHAASAGPLFEQVRFAGSDYTPALDNARLGAQYLRVFTLMRDGVWRTLDEISQATGDPHASVSAQLRHSRKARFGSHTVEKRARGERERGLFEYRVIVNAKPKELIP